MDAIKSTFANLGMARLALMMGVLFGLIAFFIYLMTRISSPDMSLLYANLDLAESGKIASKLEGLGVQVQVSGDGSQIKVPADQVGRMRMMLAESGLPSGGSIGYEIFDKSDGLGTSSFVQDVNLVRALEGELSRTISIIQGIDVARVSIVLPRRELFSREKQNASASIFLKMSGGKRLSKGQIQAIRQLVAAAIPGLLAQHISIVDNFGTLLAKGDGDEQGFSGASTADDLRQTYERTLAKNIEILLESSLGPNKAQVKVAAVLNYDKETENTETFDPEGQVIRSSQTLNDASKDTSAAAGDPATIQNNLPGAPGADQGGATGSSTNRVSETTNYEISKTVKNFVREGGTLQNLSVAVLVDGNYKTAEDGTKTYEPREEAELDKIKTLVKSAIGFKEERGDVVEIVNMAFYTPEIPNLEAEEEGFMGFSKADLMRALEIVVLGIVGILVLLLIIRPILNRVLEGPRGGAGGGGFAGSGGFAPEQLPGPGGGGGAMMGNPNMPQQMQGGGAMPSQMAPPPNMGQPGGGAQMGPMTAGTTAPDIMGAAGGNNQQLVNMGQLDGQVKTSAVKQIETIVERHPEEAASIVRSWMHQED